MHNGNVNWYNLYNFNDKILFDKGMLLPVSFESPFSPFFYYDNITLNNCLFIVKFVYLILSPEKLKIHELFTISLLQTRVSQTLSIPVISSLQHYHQMLLYHSSKNCKLTPREYHWLIQIVITRNLYDKKIIKNLNSNTNAMTKNVEKREKMWIQTSVRQQVDVVGCCIWVVGSY